jgi:hypothetical protein
VCLHGSLEGRNWPRLLQDPRNCWAVSFFQHGKAFLPDGRNTSGLRAISIIATRKGDLCTSLWQLNVANLASGNT